MTNMTAGALAEKAGGPRAARVLIVDSCSHSREGLRSSLQGVGCEVETVVGNVDAISALRVGRFDLALIDLDQPRAHGIAMTAWDLVRISRALVANLGLILMAAKRSLEAEARADELERARLVEKPINPTELGSIVRALLGEYKTSPVSSRELNHV